jgi:hypothetical protein
MTKAKQDAKAKAKKDRELTKELEMTFPASDPPESVEPGSGVTGAEVVKPTSTERRPHKRGK